MLRLTPFFAAVFLLLLVLLGGCSPATKVVAPSKAGTSPQQAGTSAQTTSDTDASAALAPRDFTADEKHDAVLLEALTHLADRQYGPALAALKVAQAAKETEEVREQIVKVEGLALRQTALEETMADIQAILDQGQGDLAGQLATQALAQYGDDPWAGKIAALKRQADTLLAVKSAEAGPQIARYRQEAESALKENNLRAAQLAFEQLLALQPDGATQKQADEVAVRLAKYDAARERAQELRKDPNTMEEAVAAYQEAAQAWNTLQIGEELADAQLALQKRRDRLAVASFEVQGDAGLAALAIALPDELLTPLKRRFDLVERGQISRLIEELKLSSDDLAISEQGRSDFGRLAKARYLVVGSISPLSGVTVHARLIDLQSGLIVQTGKITAATSEDAVRMASVLAAQLMMSDEEKLAYEQRLAQEAAPAVVNTSATLPAIPAIDSRSGAMPLVMTTSRPPGYGSLQVEDFDRLPPLPAVVGGDAGPSAQVVFLEQERPLRSRLLTLQLEMGDHFLRLGRYQDAHLRFQLARELDPGNFDIITRINLCQPHLPPLMGRPLPIVRERLAFINFFVAGDSSVVPPALATWTPEQLAPYFSAAYQIVDRGEVFWMMGRLGLTVGDVLRENSARRWLGRSLGVRYFVLGRIQQTGSFTVTTSLVDAEQGWEVGRGQVFVNNSRELKLRLPELARLTMLSPAERARLEQLALEQEAEYLRAQEAYRRGQFTLALELGGKLKRQHPFSIRIGVFLGEVQERSRFAAMEEARRREWERQRLLEQAAARRQAELALAAERARQEAIRGSLAQAERQRLHDLAHTQLIGKARLAFQNKNFNIALQFFDGALALRPMDEVLMHEAAQARTHAEEHRRAALRAQFNQQEEAQRRQRDLHITSSQQLWQTERQQWQQQWAGVRVYQRQQDEAEYARLLDQAQRQKAQGRFDQAAATLQIAKRVKPNDEVERLLTDALMEQARAQAKAQDAARLAELERKLAQEQARRKQAEQEAQKNWQLYQATLQAGQDARGRRNYSVAVAKYQEAGRLFQTDAVVQGLREAQVGLAQEAQLAAQRKLEAEEKAKRASAVSQLLAQSKTAEQAKKYDEALGRLQQAKTLDPANIEVLTALGRLERAKLNAVEAQQAGQARDQANRVKVYLAQAQSRAAAKQYEAALAVLEAAQKLAPNDGQVQSQIAAVKKSQGAAAAAVLASKQKEDDLKRQAQLRIQEEEKAKLQAAQGRQQAESALAGGDLKSAESALAAAAKLAPNDPALRKLQQELSRARANAVRAQAQADARAKLEADAQARAAAMAQQQQGKIGQILTQAQQAIAKKDFTTAEKLIGEALALDYTNLAVGKVQRELQNARQAEVQARAAMSADEKKKQDAELAKKKTEYARLMKEGREALAAEDFDKASKLFAAAAKLNPEDNDAPLLQGMADKRKVAAEKEAEAARKAAMVEEENKKREEAAAKKRAMDQAEAKKKGEEELRRKLAMDAEAKKRADMLKALNREQFDAAMKSGKEALGRQKYDDAVKAFEKAAGLMPEEKEPQAQLLLAKRLREEAAKKPATPPSKNPPPGKTPPPEKPSTPSAAQMLNQAKELQRQKKWAESLEAYKKVLAVSPQDKTARDGAQLCEFQVHFETGKSALAKKDKEAAVKALEAALKLAPGNKEVQQLLTQAKNLK